jgi:heparan-alpha-glucosaminide N-acetyltransferase
VTEAPGPAKAPAGPAAAPATVKERLASLDTFRGFDILTMIFVNYIAGMKAIPFILRHAEADQNVFTLTDVVFPGFLFIVGVSIPLALAKRRAEGRSALSLVGHVLVRTLALLFLGVLLVNENRFSAEASGLSRDLWYFLATLAVFGLWAVVPKGTPVRKKRLLLGLKIAAAIVLVVLVVVFRGQGEDGRVTMLQTSWWGILGMIGWCYMAASLLFLACRGNRTVLAGAVGLMTALYIGARHGALGFLGPVTDFVNIGSLFGSHAAIVTAGMLAGTVFLPGSDDADPRRRIRFLAVLGTALVLAGYVLRPLHGFSKIYGTESYCLATAGICCLLFLFFYIGLDVLKGRKAARFLVPAGRNPLLAYLLPGLIGNAAGLLGTLLRADIDRLLWPLAGTGGLPGMLNAVVMTGLVLLLTAVLTRAGLVLKL